MTTLDPSFVPYRLAAAYLQSLLDEERIPQPLIGIICGSGLSGLSQALEGPTLSVNYGDIPGFPAECTVAGHKGEVVFGQLSGVPTVCFRGRFHSYEGHDMKTVVLPVYVMRCLRTKVVIVTNAAGGLNPSYRVGDVVVVGDHLAIPQIAGKNALVGPNDDELGPRFPATSNAYSRDLRLATVEAAEGLGMGDIVRNEGACYCFVSGPMYESRAECRFLLKLGGDAVGMSSVPEIVAAHHCNMQVLCLSLITNRVVMDGGGHEGPVATHAEVLEAVKKRAAQMQTLVKRIVRVIDDKVLPTLGDLPPVNLNVRGPFRAMEILGIPLPSIFGIGLLGMAIGAVLATKVVKT